MSSRVISGDLTKAVEAVLQNLIGINELYPTQLKLLEALLDSEHVFYTGSTNSGKTLPTVMYPLVLHQLNKLGYNYPTNPKVLFVTALNSLQLSLLNNTKSMGIECEILTTRNASTLLESKTPVLFVSPEVLKLPLITRILLEHRSTFVLKVVDEAHLGKH